MTGSTDYRTDVAKSSFNRRRLLSLIGGGVGVVLIDGLLAACGKSKSQATSTVPTGSNATQQASSAATSTSANSTVAATSSTQSSGGGTTTLVVAANFDIQSLDPARGLDTNAEMTNHATYDSLVTFSGADISTPKPSLGKSWEVSQDGMTYTFTLQSGVKFVSGNPLTSADVKWSFDRVTNIKSNPAFLLNPVAEVQALDPGTIVLKLKSAYPGILPILSSPSLGAIDSELVKGQGGDSSPDAKDKDTAEQYLNQHSAGTGPFILDSYEPNDHVTLAKNPDYWRGAATSDRVAVQNITDAASQKTQLTAGSVDIAIGLTQDQLPALKNAQNVKATSSTTATTFYVLMNNNPDVGGPFSNPTVQQAVRLALDYDGILALAGEGAQRLAGIIPTLFPGAMDSSAAVKSDPEKAKSLLQSANLGTISGVLSYSSDQVFFGIQTSVLAQKVQADLQAVGMTISLDGLPISPALQKYRAAKDQLGVWSWTADYPDASDFLVYVPGRTVGKRAGWPEDASPDAKALADLARQAESEVDDAKRKQLYQSVDQKLVEIGPYAPLFLPAAPYAFRTNIQGVTLNSVWLVDYYAVNKSS